MPALSDCVALQASPPPTQGLLVKRIQSDEHTFMEALKSKGYFQVQVRGSIDTTTSPPTVRFAIDPGPRFVFGPVDIHVVSDEPDVAAVLRKVLGRVSAGNDYASKYVVDAEDAMVQELRRNGYPWPSLGTRAVVADHAKRDVQVRFVVNTGPHAVFGPVRLEGLHDVREETVRYVLAWEQGESFDERKLEQTQEELIRSGLFRSVRVRVDPESTPNATAPVVIAVLEAAPRTVRAGLWYYLDQGAGVSSGWTHRNVWGGGEEFSVDAELGQKLQKLDSSLMLPHVFHPDQALHIGTGYEHEETDVYESSNVKASAVFRRDFDSLQADCGLAYRLSEVDSKDQTRSFNLLSVPMGLAWTTVTNPLDPVSGFALSAQAEPFTPLSNEGDPFVLWNLGGRYYFSLHPRDTFVLATRARYSLLAGAGHGSIPEDLLLYAGGGGSIRGYAYQYAGPLTKDDEPEGGMSAIDFSVELRWRINEEFGAVLFSDGGGAFVRQNPEPSDTYFWGVGTGLRYFTPIGPIRLDVAVPLNRRSGVDDPFQLYISLGQAF
ncbi:autotransporter assembly complex family protein [Desulfovibrionales bacterium]